jgi:hypothetical protein
MASQGMEQPRPGGRVRNLARPARQHLASEGGESHPLGEALPIHFPTQHAKADQPDQLIFTARQTWKPRAEHLAVGPFRQFMAAQALVLEQNVEVPAKR